MEIYDAMFRRNGGCGFVLKPKFMLEPDLMEKWIRDNFSYQPRRITVSVSVLLINVNTLCLVNLPPAVP